MTNIITTPIPYLILDGGDGSGSLVLFKTKEARDLYLEKIDDCGDLSEGGSSIYQKDIDTAMDENDVLAEFEDQ
jgi:hypothetical protein